MSTAEEREAVADAAGTIHATASDVRYQLRRVDAVLTDAARRDLRRILAALVLVATELEELAADDDAFVDAFDLAVAGGAS